MTQLSLETVQQLLNSDVSYPDSFVVQDNTAYWIQKSDNNKKSLSIVAAADHATLDQFTGDAQTLANNLVLKTCDFGHDNARAIREALPWLKPRPLDLTLSAGFGDRLGMATPGHAQSLISTLAKYPDADILPIFAQQSIREMVRTNRSPDDVMTDATWGTLESGWQGGVGADADHQKNTNDIDSCVAAGFTFFTVDPGDHVDSQAEAVSASALTEKLNALPWDTLESSPDALMQRYVGQTVDMETARFTFDKDTLAVAAAKYGGAIAHSVNMYRHLQSKSVPFELEVSVDETETPTTHLEHIYIVQELKRLGVEWVSLAPRFVGHFEKGVDYIGDVDDLKANIQLHAEIARAFGPYKLSLHSGSDKFTVYPMIVAATQGIVHLKTAGTSYLEALRVASRQEPSFFREIMNFGIERYPTDRATYHVSAELEKVPTIADMTDDQLPELLNHFHARQVLHVTFGSALDTFGTRLKTMLDASEQAHYEGLATHFARHLEPFAQYS